MSVSDDHHRLLTYTRAAGRVCPQPLKWNELWEMLPERRRVGVGWEPPPPLILAAWWDTSDIAKRDRFELHLQHAAEHGVLDSVEQFLMNLAPNEWAYAETEAAWL